MTAVEFSPQERATLERIEAAQPAPESLRERVAQAIHSTELCGAWPCDYSEQYREQADAALAVIKGES